MSFDPKNDPIIRGSMTGAHGQPFALAYAWIHENGEDVILFNDSPRSIYGAIHLGAIEVGSRRSVEQAIRNHYLSPRFDKKAGCTVSPYGPTRYDRRALLCVDDPAQRAEQEAAKSRDGSAWLKMVD